MRRLAIDTSSTACSVAVRMDDELYERHEEKAREHTRLLMPMIRETLGAAGAGLADLDAVVLGNGPGSFIGMRIATSVAQGLAFGAGLQIIPVSSLAAVALQAFDGSDIERVAVAQDAHMSEVYLGLYARDARDSLVSVGEERLHGLAAIDALQNTAERFAIAGQGWERYPELLAANSAWVQPGLTVRYPRAASLLALSKRSAAISPDAVQPAYLRHQVASISVAGES